MPTFRALLAALALIPLAAAPLGAQEVQPALQTPDEPAPAPDYSPENAADIPPVDELPVEQSGKARCAVMIAMLASWQKQGNARGAQYPVVDQARGRAFFTKVFGDLMDSYGVTDEAKMGAYIFREYDRFAAKPAAETDPIIPPCLVLLEIVTQ